MVRIRPLQANQSDPKSEVTSATQKAANTIEVTSKDGKTFSCQYNTVLGPSSNQKEVFRALCQGRDLVDSIIQGINCTVLAYGQTGTGKTHTIIGDISDSENGWGVVPRIFASLFTRAQTLEQRKTATLLVQCSYLQIYNNAMYDLLHARVKRKTAPPRLRLCRASSGVASVENLTQIPVESVPDVLEVLKTGNAERVTRQTAKNVHSSRSHAVFTGHIQIHCAGVNGQVARHRKCSLTLVDLAGSEKWSSTIDTQRRKAGRSSRDSWADRAEETRQIKEMTRINQSLTTLGLCIAILSEGKPSHVPYRNSLLTSLLENSLGGNARSILIATISPGLGCVSETISTLKFADRARNVMQSVSANEVIKEETLLKKAMSTLRRLQRLLSPSEDDLARHKQLQAVHDALCDQLREENCAIDELRQRYHNLYRDSERELSVRVRKNREEIRRLKDEIARIKDQKNSILPPSEDSIKGNDIGIALEKVEQQDQDDENKSIGTDGNQPALQISIHDAFPKEMPIAHHYHKSGPVASPTKVDIEMVQERQNYFSKSSLQNDKDESRESLAFAAVGKSERRKWHIQLLRTQTGASYLDASRAIEESKGDIAQAIMWLFNKKTEAMSDIEQVK